MRSLLSVRHLIVGAAMLGALGLSVAMEPPKIIDRPSINLKTLVPTSIGDWTVDPASNLMLPLPDVEAELAKVYSETLSRTYINARGERLMLSIAYTGEIDRQMDLHRPEFCYPAQGFDVIVQPKQEKIGTPYGDLKVKQLVARQGPRTEPITYWITAGDTAAVEGWQRKLVKLRYGFTGQVPDGMLVRVSEISVDPPESFQRQESFIKALVAALDESGRKRFIGSL